MALASAGSVPGGWCNLRASAACSARRVRRSGTTRLSALSACSSSSLTKVGMVCHAQVPLAAKRCPSSLTMGRNIDQV